MIAADQLLCAFGNFPTTRITEQRNCCFLPKPKIVLCPYRDIEAMSLKINPTMYSGLETIQDIFFLSQL